jgi:hypothetical protein
MHHQFGYTFRWPELQEVCFTSSSWSVSFQMEVDATSAGFDVAKSPAVCQTHAVFELNETTPIDLAGVRNGDESTASKSVDRSARRQRTSAAAPAMLRHQTDHRVGLRWSHVRTAGSCVLDALRVNQNSARP